MKNMRTLTKGLVSVALLAAAFAVGCGSSSDNGDGGGNDGAAGGGGGVCPGVTLYALSDGDSCFDIVSVQAGSSDGCMLGVADTTAMMGLVGATLPVNYVAATGILSVGTMGSLGTAMSTLQCNMGTLVREGTPSLDSMPACMWHQADTSMVTITAQNEFDIAVTENQSEFTGCSAANTPAGGACMSKWTWHMKKNAAKTPPGCM
jgi:hypothetical protein